MTSIEWTDATWNPVTGCTKVSPGCAHCYAEGVAKRLWKGRPFTDVQTHKDRLDQPLRWRRPRRVFVNSMSDLFHEDVPVRFIDKIFAVMGLASKHTFQVLTKRPDRMRAYCCDPASFGRVMALSVELTDGIGGVSRRVEHCDDGLPGFQLPNVWLGVSVENQTTADERIPVLIDTLAAVRFVSCEPLLEAVDLRWLSVPKRDGYTYHRDALDGRAGRDYGCGWDQPDETGLTSLDWVIAGGESGARARPCSVHWIASLVCQCREADVPVFVKQLGAKPLVDGTTPQRLRDRKGADAQEWPIHHLRVREWPA